ncbi:hypothetical protein IFR05_015354 [Cadophora sp. M221]|nr:hypothetical protein IFR05_015354 [Cadophora sp. M221]
MGSASSRFATRWWEAEAQRKVVTTKNTGKLKVICSLIPGVNEIAMDLSKEQRADPSNLTIDFKANELWRVLQMPLENSGSPWDRNWRPPLEGIPSKIAADFHATVSGDLPNPLLRLRKALNQGHHPLAHWIVASSLNQRAGAPYDAFAANFDQIKRIFATRNFNVVLKRLAALDRRFAHGSQMYNWQKWSTDLDFWQCVNGVLWSGKFTTPLVPPHSSSEDRDERLRFLDGFKTDAEDRAWGSWGKVVFSMKRLMVRERNSEGRESQYSVNQERLAGFYGPAEG